MNRFMEFFAKKCTQLAGTSLAFFLALLSVIIWAAVGPYFEWSSDHSLAINTGTTIITFLLIFLIQRSQNKESFAIQLKLNEILAAHAGCSNRLINVEDLSENEIVKLYNRYKKLAALAKFEDNYTHAHSVEEIEED